MKNKRQKSEKKIIGTEPCYLLHMYLEDWKERQWKGLSVTGHSQRWLRVDGCYFHCEVKVGSRPIPEVTI